MQAPTPLETYWCPFCEKGIYKSQGNLNNHIEQHHEPQVLRHCHDCKKAWNTSLGRTRHIRKAVCSSRNFESTKHPERKILYACGICAFVCDDFSLRQEHLFNHQRTETPRSAWTMDNMLRGLLSHPSIAGHWNALLGEKFPLAAPLQPLSWDWNDQRTTDSMRALEYWQPGTDVLRLILEGVAETALPAVNEDYNLSIETDLDAFTYQLDQEYG